MSEMLTPTQVEQVREIIHEEQRGCPDATQDRLAGLVAKAMCADVGDDAPASPPKCFAAHHGGPYKA